MTALARFDRLPLPIANHAASRAKLLSLARMQRTRKDRAYYVELARESHRCVMRFLVKPIRAQRAGDQS